MLKALCFTLSFSAFNWLFFILKISVYLYYIMNNVINYFYSFIIVYSFMIIASFLQIANIYYILINILQKNFTFYTFFFFYYILIALFPFLPNVQKMQ